MTLEWLLIYKKDLNEYIDYEENQDVSEEEVSPCESGVSRAKLAHTAGANLLFP